MPNITVTLSPAGAISAGAEWCIEGKTEWKASGTAYLAAAGTYVVQYKYAEDYSTPAEETVAVAAIPVAVTGTYGAVPWKSGWKPPISMCLFRGQVFTCGVKHTTPDSGVSDARLVRWSEIGAFRFLDCTANPQRNEAGEYYLSYNKNEMALRVLPLKEAVIVYGSYSTVALRPVVEPAPTFSPSLVMPIGIRQPLAVAGDEEKHLLVDRNGYLRLIGMEKTEFKSKVIGHQELFEGMQSDLAMSTGLGLISIVHNPEDDEFYISDGRQSFLFREGVLTELDEAYTSYINIGGALLSVADSTYTTTYPLSHVIVLDASPYVSFTTDPFNFNLSGIKQIQSVEVLGSFEDAEVSVDWRNSKADVYRSTAWKRCSPSGICKPIVSGADFRLKCRIPYVAGIQIDSVVIEWQLSDKMNVRGNYVSSGSS
jgi:hypothetical protein